jgi:hypothetical protein
MSGLAHAAAPITVVLALVWAAPARADDGDRAREQAQAAVSQGNQLVDKDDYAGALAAYRKALALYPSSKIYFNVGQAERGLGHSVEAAEAFERFLAESGDSADTLRAEAQQYLTALQEKVGHLSLSCSVTGARVLVDGQPRGETPLPRPLVLLAGERLVRVERAGFAAREQRVAVPAGGDASLALTLEPPPVVVVPPSQAAFVTQPAPEEPARPPIYRRWWFWPAAAAVVVVAAGAVTYGIYRAGHPDCPSPCITVPGPSP